ncbi:MAG: hypothetical protein KDB90_13450 [Planctomycetes bacterium]|nr:hypothetical protein [Planctomycetota bacterium]
MIGFKVLTKDGLKGPYKKSSILKGITTAQIPLQARLLDLETGRYLSAAELVGEQPDPPAIVTEAATASEKKDMAEISNLGDKVVTDDTNELRLDEDTGSRE